MFWADCQKTKSRTQVEKTRRLLYTPTDAYWGLAPGMELIGLSVNSGILTQVSSK